MRKRTTTGRLNSAITNNLLHIAKVEVYYKTSRKTETIDADKFKDSLDFLCESDVFAGCVDWHYEKNISVKDGYILDSENIVTVYLRRNEKATDEEITKILLFEESEE